MQAPQRNAGDGYAGPPRQGIVEERDRWGERLDTVANYALELATSLYARGHLTTQHLGQMLYVVHSLAHHQETDLRTAVRLAERLAYELRARGRAVGVDWAGG